MILVSNLPQVREIAARSARVLDIGGWWRPLNVATHVMDLCPYETRRVHDALDPQNEPRYSAETWTVHDACVAPWPYPDKFFDFSFCSHTLEDVQAPATICAELIRVSRAGYIETPSRQREIFSKSRWFDLRSAIGLRPDIGFPHHLWFVEIEGSHVRFTGKDPAFLTRRRIITRGDLGRKMTEAESGVGLFWRDSFTFEIVDTPSPEDIARFRDRALRALRNSI